MKHYFVFIVVKIYLLNSQATRPFNWMTSVLSQYANLLNTRFRHLSSSNCKTDLASNSFFLASSRAVAAIALVSYFLYSVSKSVLVCIGCSNILNKQHFHKKRQNYTKSFRSPFLQIFNFIYDFYKFRIGNLHVDNRIQQGYVVRKTFFHFFYRFVHSFSSVFRSQIIRAA